MHESAQKGCEIGSERGARRESRTTSSRAAKSFHIGTALAAEVKGVALAR
jgi:hypothetical protein